MHLTATTSSAGRLLPHGAATVAHCEPISFVLSDFGSHCDQSASRISLSGQFKNGARNRAACRLARTGEGVMGVPMFPPVRAATAPKLRKLRPCSPRSGVESNKAPGWDKRLWLWPARTRCSSHVSFRSACSAPGGSSGGGCWGLLVHPNGILGGGRPRPGVASVLEAGCRGLVVGLALRTGQQGSEGARRGWWSRGNAQWSGRGGGAGCGARW